MTCVRAPSALELCVAALLCLRGGAVRQVFEDASGLARGISHSGAYFVFLEVYMLKKSTLSDMSAASSAAADIAGFVQLGGSGSGASQAGGNSSEASGALYHSEVLICPRSDFDDEAQRFLEQTIDTMWNYEELKKEWWQQATEVMCQTLSYGSRGISWFKQRLSEAKSGISNADLEQVEKFIYGTSDRSASDAKDIVTADSCHDYWTGKEYHPVSRNCNYFSKAVLDCGFGLSQSLPNLGISSTRWLWSCDC